MLVSIRVGRKGTLGFHTQKFETVEAVVHLVLQDIRNIAYSLPRIRKAGLQANLEILKSSFIALLLGEWNRS